MSSPLVYYRRRFLESFVVIVLNKKLFITETSKKGDKSAVFLVVESRLILHSSKIPCVIYKRLLNRIWRRYFWLNFASYMLELASLCFSFSQLLEWTTVASELHFNLYPPILYLAIYPVGNKAKRLLSENDFTKSINQRPNLTTAAVGVALQITLSDLTTVAVGDRLNVFITVCRYITFL